MKTNGNKGEFKNAERFLAAAVVSSVSRLLVQGMVVAAIASTFSCAPLSSDLQSARMVGKKRVEITPGHSTVQFAEEKPQQHEKKSSQESSGRLVGLQVAYGLSDKVDLRLRVEHFEYREFTANVFSIGPKIRLVKDRVALYLPVWFVDFKPVQLQPTVLLTFPLVKNKIEFNPSVKSLLSVGGYDPNTGIMFACNGGLGISTNLAKWALRPEYGVVYDVREKCRYMNFSIGLTLNLSLLKGRR